MCHDLDPSLFGQGQVPCRKNAKFVSSQYLLNYDKQAEILQVCMKVNTDHTMCKTCIQVPW